MSRVNPNLICSPLDLSRITFHPNTWNVKLNKGILKILSASSRYYTSHIPVRINPVSGIPATLAQTLRKAVSG